MSRETSTTVLALVMGAALLWLILWIVVRLVRSIWRGADDRDARTTVARVRLCGSCAARTPAAADYCPACGVRLQERTS